MAPAAEYPALAIVRRLALETLNVPKFLETLPLGLLLVEDVALGRGRVDLDEGEERGDGVQPVFDRRITNAELGFHILDGTMAADEGHDEKLVLARQAGQGRQLEVALDGDLLIFQPDTLDGEGRPLRQPGQFVPILGHFALLVNSFS